MSNIDIVKAGMDAWSRGDVATLGGMLADDFTLIGPAPFPVTKEMFLGLCSATIGALPDWKFNAHDFREVGDKVYATTRITGTQTGTLPEIFPGVPAVPPTGKPVELPDEAQTYTLRDGKLVSLEVPSSPDGGYAGLYAQIGHPLPRP